MWNIKFNKDIILDDVTKNAILVENNGTKVDVTVEQGSTSTSLLVKAPSSGYKIGEKYTLKIGSNVHTKDSKSIKNAIEMQFTVGDSIQTQERGNTSGNIKNGSSYVLKGDYIYATNFDGTYRIKKDDTGKVTIVNSIVSNLNVVGDWIYYSKVDDGIYKSKADGTGIPIKLNSDNAQNMTVIGDCIYYINGLDNKIYKMSTNGSDKKNLNNDSALQLNVMNGFIYYINNGVYKMSIDSTNKTKLIAAGFLDPDYKTGMIRDTVSEMNIDGDWMYYIGSGGKIYKIKTDGTGGTTVSNDIAQCINVSDGWIYYLNKSEGDSLYKIKIDGTGRTQVVDDLFAYMNVIGDYIYSDGHGERYARIKNDGTDKKILCEK